jgi:hypothetical protein
MYKAWTVKAAKQPMVLETVDREPLGAEDVEVAVEHCATRMSPSSTTTGATRGTPRFSATRSWVGSRPSDQMPRGAGWDSASASVG